MSQSQNLGIANGCTCRDLDTSSHPQLHTLLQPLRHVASKVGGLIELSRQRRALGELDDRLLDDIGLSRSEANRDSETRFWRSYARRHLK